ncbi:PLP-dependent aminotransferase family protein [Dactylosporangium sp. CS-033363]|uniref:aminotransferase-like domain-containing protein n=1 Tax=Dactylosporangium sp. CS-033363 TaxID=3239935 RepID=UPI003D8E430B
MVVLSREALHTSVVDPVSASMNFLNEVASRFPEAISLAAGRPFDEFHEVTDIDKHIQAYLNHLRERGLSAGAARQLLTQYGRTNGHIGDLIARMLDVDENIQVPAAAVMVTTGCQEAMIIALRGLCAGPDDVVLAAEPCYVGLTGAARILGVEVVGVPESADGLRPETVRAVAAATRARGKNPKALYLVPNFANPSGVSLPVSVRRALLAAAADEDLLILEDDPYGLFGLDDEPRPTLKSLDNDQRVIYLGSFAKSYFPGARVGYLVADQTVADAEGRRTLLAEELSTVKSMLTVNTSALSQAVVGGMLIDAGFSLRTVNQAKIAFYRHNLQTLLAALQKHFAGTAVRWNSPSGGFFVVCEVPVDASEDLLEISAREYGVLWTPMRFFYVDGGGTHALRLSCSALEPAQIGEGVRRLAALLRR